MRIAVAVDGTERDAAVLAWSAAFAQPGDDVHVVHAYQALALGGSVWMPAVRANDSRRDKARRVINSAQASLHRSLDRARQIVVGGSVLVGWPHQVLADLSTVADILVVGSRPGPGPVSVLDGACPVIVVPTEWRRGIRHGRSVGVPCGTDLPIVAMDRAVELAHRSLMSVLVLRCTGEPVGSGVSEPVSVAGHLEQLDLQVAPWEHVGGPAIVAEVRREDPAAALRSLTHVLGLLVVEAGALPANLLRLVVDELQLPVVVVQPDYAAALRAASDRPVLQPL
jgi:hypothetical protein